MNEEAIKLFRDSEAAGEIYIRGECYRVVLKKPYEQALALLRQQAELSEFTKTLWEEITKFDPEEQEFIKPLLVYIDTQAEQIEQLQGENERYKNSLKEIRDLETECCSRCEGNGQLWADGKVHLPSYQGNTIPCGNCGGSGRILPDNAQDIAEQALKGEGNEQEEER